MTQFVISKAIHGAWDGHDTPPEQNMIEWAAQFLDASKLFLDIGAHVGTYCLQYATAGATCVAFEAQRDTFYRLCAGVVLNDLSDRVRAINVALGEGDAKAIELKIVSADGGGSSTLRLSTHENPIATEKVELRTLDSYALKNIGLIKIDVEGAELSVLRGARKTLEASGYPTILFETWRASRMPEAAQLRADLFSFLAELGYLIHATTYDEMFLAVKGDAQ